MSPIHVRSLEIVKLKAKEGQKLSDSSIVLISERDFAQGAEDKTD